MPTTSPARGCCKRRLGSRIALAQAGGADGRRPLSPHGDEISFGAHHLDVRATPGHTSGCVTYVLDDRQHGLHRRLPADPRHRAHRLPAGRRARRMYRSVHEQIFSLPEDCLLYPAHDYRGLTVTSVAEEKRFNPRLGGEIGDADFVGHMANLELAHPKQIDVAVPANLQLRPARERRCAAADPGWAPLTFTFAGIWEIQPQALEEYARSLADPRRARAGRIRRPAGAYLRRETDSARRARRARRRVRKDRPSSPCAAPGAARPRRGILQQAGFTEVANLAGGMLRWRAEGHAVEGGQVAERRPASRASRAR